MSIYLEKFPGKIQEILKYFHGIRLAASREGHAGWANYDEQFRLKKERHPSSSWGVVDYELWVMYINASPGQPSQPFDSTNTMNAGCSDSAFQQGEARSQDSEQEARGIGQVPSRTMGQPNPFKSGGCCFAFNKGSCSRNPCKFRHRCISCGGPHPQVHCYMGRN